MMSAAPQQDYDPRRFGTCDSNRLDFTRATLEVIEQLCVAMMDEHTQHVSSGKAGAYNPKPVAQKILNLSRRVRETI